MHPEAEALLEEWWPKAQALCRDHVHCVQLFGSVTNEDYQPGWSDIDVCVLLDTPLEPETAALDEEYRDRIEATFLAEGQPRIEGFGRLQIATRSICWFGEPAEWTPPTREALVADMAWLFDALEETPGDFSAIRLAGLLMEVARQTVFWRDGEWLSKTAALQREGYDFVLRLRCAGSAACADHIDELRDQVHRIDVAALRKLVAN